MFRGTRLAMDFESLLAGTRTRKEKPWSGAGRRFATLQGDRRGIQRLIHRRRHSGFPGQSAPETAWPAPDWAIVEREVRRRAVAQALQWQDPAAVDAGNHQPKHRQVMAVCRSASRRDPGRDTTLAARAANSLPGV